MAMNKYGAPAKAHDRNIVAEDVSASEAIKQDAEEKKDDKRKSEPELEQLGD